MLNAAAWLTLAGLLAAVAGTASASAAETQRCGGRGGGTPPETRGSDLGKFLVGTKSFALPFDEHRDPLTRTISVPAYTNLVAPRNVTASIDEDLVSERGHSIGFGVTAAAEVVKIGNLADPTTIRVCVRLDPRTLGDFRPGRYTGTVVLRADNFQEAAIPISATFRAPRSDGLKMAVAGVLLGLVVKMLTELGSVRRARGQNPKATVREYFLQWSFPLAIILGVLTGWLGFVEIYESSATWGVGGADSLKLFGTCFGFQMGSIGGADMTKRLVG